MKVYYQKPFMALLAAFFFSNILTAQVDTLIMTDGTELIGELKDMKQGVIIMETGFSDSDFEIEWDKVKEIKSERTFIVNTSKGIHLNGTINTDPENPDRVIVNGSGEGTVSFNILDVVYLKPVKDTFLSRLSLLLSAGYTLTKANNNHQFSTRFNSGYLSSTFGADLYFSAVRTFQTVNDSIKTSTKRTEGGFGLKFYLIKDWFVLARNDMLQSTEQELKLRSVSNVGIGNYLVNTNSLYFMISAGGAWNYEMPEIDSIAVRNSLEGFGGLEFNIFDFGDLNLKTSYMGYISITESPRFRSDFNFDIKYDFPLDFFINLGFTLNYDSRPIPGASTIDYVLQTTIGWEL